MTKLALAVLAAAMLAMPGTAGADGGIQTVVSKYPLPETVSRLRHDLEAAGMRVATIVEHASGTRAATAEREPSELLIVGDPKARARLMSANPLLALDLPVKVLVWDDEGQIKASFNEPEFLQSRHTLSEAEMQYFHRIERLIGEALD